MPAVIPSWSCLFGLKTDTLKGRLVYGCLQQFRLFHALHLSSKHCILQAKCTRNLIKCNGLKGSIESSLKRSLEPLIYACDFFKIYTTRLRRALQQTVWYAFRSQYNKRDFTRQPFLRGSYLLFKAFVKELSFFQGQSLVSRPSL